MAKVYLITQSQMDQLSEMLESACSKVVAEQELGEGRPDTINATRSSALYRTAKYQVEKWKAGVMAG